MSARLSVQFILMHDSFSTAASSRHCTVMIPPTDHPKHRPRRTTFNSRRMQAGTERSDTSLASVVPQIVAFSVLYVQPVTAICIPPSPLHKLDQRTHAPVVNRFVTDTVRTRFVGGRSVLPGPFTFSDSAVAQVWQTRHSWTVRDCCGD